MKKDAIRRTGILKLDDKSKKQPSIQDIFEKASRIRNAFELEMKRRRREDHRRCAVELVGGILAFIGVNGSFFILMQKFGLFSQLTDRFGLGSTLSAIIIVVIWIGFSLFIVLTFFWFSDKTGLNYLIEDWVVSWDSWNIQHTHNIYRFRTFPRSKRKPLVRYLKKELDVFIEVIEAIRENKKFEESPELEKRLNKFPDLKKTMEECNAAIFNFGKQACDTHDKELYDYDDDEVPTNVEGSLKKINRIIGKLVEEVDISSRSLMYQPKHASWKGFVLALEETSNELYLELEDVEKYHKAIQPLLKHAFNITSQILSCIVDYDGEKKIPIIKENKAGLAAKTTAYCLLIYLVVSALSNVARGNVSHPYSFVVVIIGFCCVVLSKTPSFKKGKKIYFGTKNLSENMSNLCRLGYWLMAVGILTTFI